MTVYYINADKGDTLAGIPWGSVLPGDTISLKGTFYERLAIPVSGTVNAPITIEGLDNATITPRYDINGTNGITSAGVPTTSSWVNVSGGIWKKVLGPAPRYVFLDGIKYDPKKALNLYNQTESWLIANLQPNEWAVKSGFTLYVNFGSSSPASTDIRTHGMHITEAGAIGIDTVNNIVFKNLTVRDFISGPQTTGTNAEKTYKTSAIYLKNSSNIVFDNVSVLYNLLGMYVSGGSNITIKSNCSISYNEGSGLGVDGYFGTTDRLLVSGTYDSNGTNPIFDGTVWNVGYDCDGIGIGQLGGTVTNMRIVGAKLLNNGSSTGTIPSYAGGTLNRGSGIYMGTGVEYPMTVELDIIGCIFDNNYRYACNLNGPSSVGIWKGGRIIGNIVKNTRYDPATAGVGAMTIINPALVFSKTTIIANNTFTNNTHSRALFVAFRDTQTAKISNNLFYNALNAGSVAGQADLNIDRARDNPNVIESNNLFYRTDSETIVRYWSSGASETKTINMSTDTSSYIATYQAAGKMLNWVKSNPLLDANLVPGSGSPAIAGGYKYWAGARPYVYGGEPLPDTAIDIGAVQSTGNAGHPKNLVNSANPTATAMDLISYGPEELEAQLDKVTELDNRIDTLETYQTRGIFTTETIVADGVTDAGPALRALITQAKTTASATNRVLLKITPGTYAVSGQLDLGPFVDLDMRGAVLKFTDTSLDDKLTIGSLTTANVGGSYLGLNITNGNLFYGTNGHKFRDGLVGVHVINSSKCNFEIIQIYSFTIGLRLSAYNFSGNSSLFTSYNNIRWNSIFGCKTGVDLHSLGLGGWVNENKFFGGDISPTSDLARFGSCYGIRYSVEGTSPYTGMNQNVFFSPSFQLSSPEAWSSGKTGMREHNILYNPTTFIEYKITTVGENITIGTVAPSHTSGSWTDSAGVVWEYVGPCRRAPVFCDGAGGYNRIYGARWEGGFGPFMIGKGAPSTTAGSRTRGNIFEVSMKQTVPEIFTGSDEMEECCFDNSPIASAFSEILSYDKSFNDIVSFENIHLKAVESSAGVTVPGFEHGTSAGATADKNIGTGLAEILYDGIYFKSHTGGNIALLLNTSVTKRYEISYSIPGTGNNRGRLRLRCLDASKSFYSDLNTVGVARAWGSFEAAPTATEYTMSNFSTGNAAFATRHDTKYLRVHFQGELSTATKTIIKSIRLRAKTSSLNTPNMCGVEIENRIPLNWEDRYSNGTPIAGAFLTLGEQIKNISGTAGQPLYWTVTTSGYLCKAWATATLYIVGSLVSNGGTNYRCVTEHTSSAAFATDSANWTSIGTPAVLLASAQVY